jgi:hypothetical protein
MNFPDVRAAVKNWKFVKWWLRPKDDAVDKKAKIIEVAAKLGVPADWLDGVIAFESRYDPQAKSGYPYNKSRVDKYSEAPKYARGLIQFIDTSAQGLGYANEVDLIVKCPDFNSQMDGPVYEYFRKMMPFVSKSDLYMAVFYPAYRRKPAATVFPDSVLAANPGIRTPADYIAKAEMSVASIRLMPVAAGSAVALVAGAVILYLISKGQV